MQKDRFGTLLLAMALLCGAAVPAPAHHSAAMFDQETSVTLEGTVTQVNWGYPHSLFFVDAKPVGSSEPVRNWALEGPSPANLTKNGWTMNTIKQGDKITFSGNPGKKGRPNMLLKEVITSDGKHYSAVTTVAPIRPERPTN